MSSSTWWWLGNTIMDLYYHLHDDDSQKTMIELAKSNSTDLAEDHFEDSLRTVEQLK